MTEQTAPAAAPDTIVMPLRRPITVHGAAGPEQQTALTLKLPSGRTVLKLGEPFTTKLEQDGSGVTRIEFKVIPALAEQYLAEMSGLAADLLAHLHPHDVLDAFDHLRDMLRPTKG